MPIPIFTNSEPAFKSSLDFCEFFGVDDFGIFEQREQSEGYLAGLDVAKRLQETILQDFSHRSRTFRESLLNGLRETL